MINQNVKSIVLTGVVAAVIVLAVQFGINLFKSHSIGASFGATAGNLLMENYDPYVMSNRGITTNFPIQANGGLTIGSAGTQQTNNVFTTCSPLANGSIAASTTGYAYCTGVTGITSADTALLAEFSTTTTGWLVAADGFFVVSAKASTTAGAVDLGIYNASGKTAVPSAVGRAASTTVIHAGH